jgi:Bacterial Ig-like domain (group 1)
LKGTAPLAAFVALMFVLSAVSSPVLAATSTSTGAAASLSLAVVPPILPADGKTHSVVFLSLMDANHNPTIALASITVYLSSSKQDVAVIQSPLVFPAGASYVTANATVTLSPGTTTITASTSGLASATANLQTMTPAGFPTTLAIFASPAIQPSGIGRTGSLVVEVLDQVGRPTRAASDTTVTLTSSNEAVAVPGGGASVTVKGGQTYASASYTSDPSALQLGTTTITALASGLNSGYTAITVAGNNAASPVSLSLQAGPSELISDGRSYAALTVILLTNQSAPALAGKDTFVELASSDPNVIQVPPVAPILTGQSYVTVNVTATVSPGKATITAAYPGLATATVAFDTVALAPSKVVLYVAPSKAVLSRSGGTDILFAQLQDGSGNPGLARAAATVIIASSNPSFGHSPINVTIGADQNYATVRVHLAQPTQLVLTASSPGLESSTAPLSASLMSMTASIAASSYTVPSNQKVTLTVTVAALGVPLANTTVAWSSKGGTFSRSQTTTNPQGVSSVEFTPTGTGPATILAQVADQIIGKANLSASIFVVAPVNSAPPTILDTIMGHLYYFIAGVAAVVAVAVLLVVRRRRKKKMEGEADEALSEDSGASF